MEEGESRATCARQRRSRVRGGATQQRASH